MITSFIRLQWSQSSCFRARRFDESQINQIIFPAFLKKGHTMRYAIFPIAVAAGIALLSFVVRAEPKEMYLENFSRPDTATLTARKSTNCEIRPTREDNKSYVNEPVRLKPRLCFVTPGPVFSATLGPLENGPLHLDIMQRQKSGRYGLSLGVSQDAAAIRAGITLFLQNPNKNHNN
jgi:hypothetical protein